MPPSSYPHSPKAVNPGKTVANLELTAATHGKNITGSLSTLSPPLSDANARELRQPPRVILQPPPGSLGVSRRSHGDDISAETLQSPHTCLSPTRRRKKNLKSSGATAHSHEGGLSVNGLPISISDGGEKVALPPQIAASDAMRASAEGEALRRKALKRLELRQKREDEENERRQKKLEEERMEKLKDDVGGQARSLQTETPRAILPEKR